MKFREGGGRESTIHRSNFHQNFPQKCLKSAEKHIGFFFLFLFWRNPMLTRISKILESVIEKYGIMVAAWRSQLGGNLGNCGVLLTEKVKRVSYCVL